MAQLGAGMTPLMFIDMPDGSVVIPTTGTILDAAELARSSGGRLRIPDGTRNMATNDATVGCTVLGDWRT